MVSDQKVAQYKIFFRSDCCGRVNLILKCQINLSICNICVKHKILSINEMKWDKILLKLKVLDWEKCCVIPRTFVKFWDIVCQFFLFLMAWTKVLEILDNIRQFFQVILTIFTLILWDFTEFNEKLWDFLNVYKG